MYTVLSECFSQEAKDFSNTLDLSGGSVVENLPADAGDVGLIPGSGRSPGEGNGNLLQYSSLGSPMDRRAWRAIVCGGPKRVGYDLET